MSKDYQGLWKNQLKNVARKNMVRSSLAHQINRSNPENAFALVVTLIEQGDEDDQRLLKAFRDAKLNVEDPFHWWQLLHDLIMIHSDRPVGASKLWTEEKIRKLEKDCIKVGQLPPATTSITKICKRLKDDMHYDQTPDNLKTLVTRLKLTDRIKKKIARTVAK